jgi:hypothetical protein
VSVPAPVTPPPPAVEVPMNFNDIFAAKPSTKSDRPGV